MATMWEDLAGTAIQTAGNTFGTAVSASGGLITVDLKDAGNNRATALLTSTAVAGSGVVGVKIQESTDDSTWTDITNPVTAAAYTFTNVSAANDIQILSFNTNKRYVRGYGTLVSGTSATIQLQFLAQRKMNPANTPGWINETGPA